MRKDYGLYLCAILCLLVLASTWSNYRGYSLRLSDWSNVDYADWATNNPVAEYYTGNPVKLFRNNTYGDYINDFKRKDTLYVAIDYYALLPVAINIIPLEILAVDGALFEKGGVSVWRTYIVEDTVLVWERK